MGQDPLINWHQSSPFAIAIDPARDIWHAGNVRDVLELDSGGVVAATESGGVWIIEPNGSAMPLSDSWDHPDTNCLAFGPDGNRHLFAGTEDGVLWETDMADPLPILNWRQIPGPADPGPIYKIVILAPRRLIVIATKTGIFWSQIPGTGQTNYSWKRALDNSPKKDGGYWRIAAGYTKTERGGFGENLTATTIIAGGMANGAEVHGLFVAQWSRTGDLVIQAAKLFDAAGNDATVFEKGMGPVSVASCDQMPNFAYAACSAADGGLEAVLRSKDGGRSWTIRGTNVKGTSKDLRTLAGSHGADRNNAIAVAPFNADYVALGWQEGPFTSLDGGDTWLQVAGGSPHLHSDLHVVYFPPAQPVLGGVRHRLYVGGDGGLVFTDDLATLDPQSFVSTHNRSLLNLQCSQPVPGFGRGFYGSLAPSDRVDGLLSTGLQDHGNCYAVIGPSPTPWSHVANSQTGVKGDGGNNVFVGDLLISDIGGQKHNPPLSQAHWSSGQLMDDGPISVSPTGSSVTPGGLVDGWAFPVKKGRGGKRPDAVVAKKNELYGAFIDASKQKLHLQYMGSIVDKPAVDITAVGSLDGTTLLVGTSDGRFYAFDSSTGGTTTLPINVQPPAAVMVLSSGGTVGRVALGEDGSAYATVNGMSWTDGTNTVTQNTVVRLETLHWIARAAGLPTNEPFYTLEVDWRSSQPPAFVATDTTVYVTRDEGQSWHQASQGLPARPHCSQLSAVRDKRGTYLYLSTWGRSVWIARLDADMGVPLFP
jgi:hypothetical protein